MESSEGEVFPENTRIRRYHLENICPNKRNRGWVGTTRDRFDRSIGLIRDEERPCKPYV